MPSPIASVTESTIPGGSPQSVPNPPPKTATEMVQSRPISSSASFPTLTGSVGPLVASRSSPQLGTPSGSRGSLNGEANTAVQAVGQAYNPSTTRNMDGQRSSEGTSAVLQSTPAMPLQTRTSQFPQVAQVTSLARPAFPPVGHENASYADRNGQSNAAIPGNTVLPAGISPQTAVLSAYPGSSASTLPGILAYESYTELPKPPSDTYKWPTYHKPVRPGSLVYTLHGHSETYHNPLSFPNGFGRPDDSTAESAAISIAESAFSEPIPSASGTERCASTTTDAAVADVFGAGYI